MNGLVGEWAGGRADRCVNRDKAALRTCCILRMPSLLVWTSRRERHRVAAGYRSNAGRQQRRCCGGTGATGRRAASTVPDARARNRHGHGDGGRLVRGRCVVVTARDCTTMRQCDRVTV
eukprot:366049-Chlamydomonas_euryale.AAC.8